jgi:DNA replication initiation complex subunit (GINS family)
MTQLTFDSFLMKEEHLFTETVDNRAKTSILVLILKDFNVAWKDKDWYLHSQDLVYLEQELASLLMQRKVAMKVEVPS